jgi:DNA-binding protein H-NS
MTATAKTETPKATKKAPPATETVKVPVSEAAIDLATLSGKALQALINEASERLGEVQSVERESLKARVASIVENEGYRIEDLFGITRGRAARGSGRSRTPRPGYVAKVYRNPDNHMETWGGHGRRPKWLMDRLEKGEKQESFLAAPDVEESASEAA